MVRALDAIAAARKPPYVHVAVVGNARNYILTRQELEVGDFKGVSTQERHRLRCPMDYTHHAACATVQERGAMHDERACMGDSAVPPRIT